MGDGFDRPLSGPVLRAQWAGHERARRELLESALSTTDAWIASRADREAGPVGIEFLDTVRRTGLTQEIDIFHRGLAHYVSLDMGSPANFVNRITYGPAAADDLIVLYSGKAHEWAHGLQKMRSAALHASPFNRATRIVICPRDWVTLQERCEEDAYAKQAWFNSLLADDIPDVMTACARDALTPAQFAAVREESGSLAAAITACARIALDKSFYWDNPDSLHRFRDHYHLHTLDNYAAGISLRAKRGDTDIVFVRLEEEDIASIGASIGPNSFAPHGKVLPEFLNTPALKQTAREKLDTLNASLGIADENTLPTLTQALAALGLTRAELVRRSYSAIPAIASTPANAPGVAAAIA